MGAGGCGNNPETVRFSGTHGPIKCRYAPLLNVLQALNPPFSLYSWYAKSIFALQSSRSRRFMPAA
jgi:hypothetical protein